MTLNEKIGAVLRSKRALRRMSQEQAAPLLGLKSKNSVSRIEAGVQGITVELLQRYCEILNCDMHDVLDEAEKL